MLVVLKFCLNSGMVLLVRCQKLSCIPLDLLPSAGFNFLEEKAQVSDKFALKHKMFPNEILPRH